MDKFIYGRTPFECIRRISNLLKCHKGNPLGDLQEFKEALRVDNYEMNVAMDGTTIGKLSVFPRSDQKPDSALGILPGR